MTDVNGVPVTGLAASNFKVYPLLVGPGGYAVNITEVFAQGLPGCYAIKVVPISGGTWKSGMYVFGVAVERGGKPWQACSWISSADAISKLDCVTGVDRLHFLQEVAAVDDVIELSVSGAA